jgi:hypothetical protein
MKALKENVCTNKKSEQTKCSLSLVYGYQLNKGNNDRVTDNQRQGNRGKGSFGAGNSLNVNNILVCTPGQIGFDQIT